MILQTRALRYAGAAGLAGLVPAIAGLLLFRGTGWDIPPLLLLTLPVFLFLAGLLIGRRADSMARTIRDQEALFEETRERLSRMAHEAITADEWDVGIEDSQIPTCWEVKGCREKDCPVYGMRNVRCWFITATFCEGDVQGAFAQKLAECSKCEVYLQAVSADPTSAIRENFYNLLWSVNEKAVMLSARNSELKVKNAELELLQAETKKLAETDALTGLHNYGHFNDFLKREVAEARRYGRTLSLLMLDLDHFKSINELHGYQKGDVVLKKFADFLQEEVGVRHYVARYGNEEFVIVMCDVDGGTAVGTARKIVSKAHRVAIDSEIPQKEFSVSVGVADFPDCANDNQSLLSAADAALFLAKNKGRNSVAYFCDLSEMALDEGDIRRLKNRLHGAGLATLKALAKAVDTTDQYSSDDRNAFNRYANGVAERLGMDEDDAELLVLATCIHDIGKIGVPSTVLNKKDKLLPSEVEMVKKHPEIGQEILREARQIQELVLAILYHHERWDGTGYPEKLKGKKIPLLARIVGLFDAYRAMRCDRPYRKALSKEQAIAELRKGAGTQFDPELVEVFIEQLQDEDVAELKNAS